MNKVRRLHISLRQETGSALILALMVLTLMLVLGSAALGLVSTDHEINSVRNNRNELQMSAESAIAETIAHLETQLSKDPLYLAKEKKLQYSPESGNKFVAEIVYKDNFIYEINVGQGILKLPPNYRVTVQGSAYGDSFTPGKETELPLAFQKAIYSIGTVDIAGSTIVVGSVHGQAPWKKDKSCKNGRRKYVIGKVKATKNSKIYKGPVTATDEVSVKNHIGNGVSTSTKQNVYAPIISSQYISVVKTNSLKLNSSYYKNYRKKDLDVDKIPNDSVVYIDGRINLVGDLGAKRLLIYSTGDMYINARSTSSESRVAFLTKGKMTVSNDSKLYGILWANKSIKLGKSNWWNNGGVNRNDSTDSTVITNGVVGSVVSNQGLSAKGNAAIKYNGVVVKDVLKKWTFSNWETEDEPTFAELTVDGVRITEWKEY